MFKVHKGKTPEVLNELFCFKLLSNNNFRNQTGFKSDPLSRLLYYGLNSLNYLEPKITQLTITCSKSKIETREKGVKYV